MLKPLPFKLNVLNMTSYKAYLDEIIKRKKLGLHPKPIDDSELTEEIVSIISGPQNSYRSDAVNFFIYNILPGTTPAAEVKAEFFKSYYLWGGEYQ